MMPDDPKPVTGEWVTLEPAPEPDPVVLDVHPIRAGADITDAPPEESEG